MKKISVRNATLHNLKGIDVDLPTGKMIAVTGVSGSGKSTLAFDILFEAGRQSYLQALGVLASLGTEHGYDEIEGLMPAVAIRQGIIRRSNPRSVVGTKTRLLNYLATFYADQHNRKVSVEEAIQPSQFSFNSPLGMCLSCQGRGVRFDFDYSVLLPTPETTLSQLYDNALAGTTFAKRIEKLQSKLSLDPAAPFTSLPHAVQQLVLHGKSTAGIRQVSLFALLQHRLNRGKPVNGAIAATVCSDCGGHRVGDEARSIVVNGKHIGQLGLLTISELHDHLLRTAGKFKSKREKSTGVDRLLLDKALSITEQLIAVRLDYLTPYRPVPSLSGGEIQRLFLMSHLKANISPLLYVFDEPTAGLHELEKLELIARLKALATGGNTVLVVEHDRQSLEAADYIVDIGPLAGRQGGEVIYQGTVSGLKKCKQSLTGQSLYGRIKNTDRQTPDVRTQEPRKVNAKNDTLVLSEVSTNNLKKISVKIPLGVLVGVAGMSGSGKSSLIADTLVPAVSAYLSSGRGALKASVLKNSVQKKSVPQVRDDSVRVDRESIAREQVSINQTDTIQADTTRGRNKPRSENPTDSEQAAEINLAQATPVYRSVTGAEHLDRCVEVSQAPIGRRSNSTVVSYLGIWDRIRSLFAGTDQAVKAGYSAGHFSFNAAGACQQCNGVGHNQMWLGGALVSYPCDVCSGQRYQDDVLAITYNGLNITDALALSVAEATDAFAADKPVTKMLDVVSRTGMDYITLGQPTNTLSGGEAQRIKLAKELGRTRKNVRCLYILDEPTTGLSLYDTGKLMTLLHELVSLGNSVIVVEHDPLVLAQCDWLLELGPAGGRNGGKVIAQGTPSKLRQSKKSLIGEFLQ